MKHTAWYLLLFVCLAVGFGSLGGLLGDGPQAVAAPPLSLEGFMDEKLPVATGPAEDVLADNSACYVCHDNYDGEPLALIHAKEDYGCIECHGPSYDHRNDEDNITPPDVMYAAEDIAEKCAECHDTHNAPATKVLARWQKRCPAKTNPAELVCTDCHGRHRLKFRTTWWDKKTRELVIRGDERVKFARDLTKVEGQAAADKPTQKKANPKP